MRLDRTLAVALLAAFLGSTPAARAAEGVIEINEDSVQAGGGFPVTITGPGSYMLTSNLVVTNANQSALVLSGNEITLDLRGFALIGPNTCTGLGSEKPASWIPRSRFLESPKVPKLAFGRGDWDESPMGIRM